MAFESAEPPPIFFSSWNGSDRWAACCCGARRSASRASFEASRAQTNLVRDPQLDTGLGWLWDGMGTGSGTWRGRRGRPGSSYGTLAWAECAVARSAARMQLIHSGLRSETILEGILCFSLMRGPWVRQIKYPRVPFSNASQVASSWPEPKGAAPRSQTMATQPLSPD